VDNFTSLRLSSGFLKRQERVEKLAYYTFEELMKQTEEVIRQRKSLHTRTHTHTHTHIRKHTHARTHTHTHALAHIYRLFFQQESLRKCILPLRSHSLFLSFIFDWSYFIFHSLIFTWKLEDLKILINFKNDVTL